MDGLANALRWELSLQARSFIYPATVVSTLMICGFILVLPVVSLPPHWVTFFVFMDPAMIGLSFVGAIVLMEKTEGTIHAVGVSPMRPWVYVASKTISLTMLTFASGVAVALVAADTFDAVKLLLALTLSSVVAVLVGFACVARVPSMNKLTITLLWVSMIAYAPLLAHFDVLPAVITPLVALIPSYAVLIALTDAIDPSAVSRFEQVYAYTYLSLWCFVGWWWALREFRNNIVTDGR